MCNQRVKIEVLDRETQLTTTITFAVTRENLECMQLPLGEILREGRKFAKQTNLAVPPAWTKKVGGIPCRIARPKFRA